MRVLVVENFQGTSLGQVGVALSEAGAQIDLRVLHEGATLPQASIEHDAIVVLGGAQNALDDEGSPYIPALLELMRDFIAADKSVLGICLGAQLLARAAGGTNQIGGATEFGWHRMALTPDATQDPVFARLDHAFPIFEWHDDTFTLPPGATHLATSSCAANQAFRLGRAAYGIQFHFEADTVLVREWSECFAEVIADRNPHWPMILETEIAVHGEAADAAGLALARGWVSTVRPSANPA
ncbi:GMP synthase [Mesorhizobium sp. NBSH29]|uniref:type 1 glutamine amidotransferase n=1 Tax=Mesorhizobium sp. NBSH29 TaxID=2654249 RepID=UPI0018964432|nr:type 1 glutamine amidotransferase [Mesorhizobium sp. NBSH29]QPC86825.1 GMP synthase [Mesorhizobium sp. NBSH29]